MMNLEFSTLDILGREIMELLPAKHYPAGKTTLHFELKTLPAGTYFLQIKSLGGQGIWKFVKME